MNMMRGYDETFECLFPQACTWLRGRALWHEREDLRRKKANYDADLVRLADQIATNRVYLPTLQVSTIERLRELNLLDLNHWDPAADAELLDPMDSDTTPVPM